MAKSAILHSPYNLVHLHITGLRNRAVFGEDTYTTHGSLQMSFDGSTIAQTAWDVQENYALNLTSFDGTIDFSGTSGSTLTYLNQSDAGSLYYDSDLSQFIGDGTLDISFDLLGDAASAMSLPGNGSSQIRTLGFGEVTVTYNYIPEPATLGLLGFISGGIVLVRRRFIQD